MDRWGARRAGGGALATSYEMAPHDGCCAHDHDCDAENCGAMWCLHQYIDTDKVRLFSETERERERERESTLGIPAHAGNISTKRRTLRRFDSFLTPAYGSITLVCLSLCSQVRALNEEVPGSCKDLFRSWEDRLDLTKVCLPTDQYSHPILAAGTVL